MNKQLGILAALGLFFCGSVSTFGYTRPNDANIKAKLKTEQYYVTQQKGVNQHPILTPKPHPKLTLKNISH